ncbi:MAG: transcriptional repressor LexA [Spirochaetaceae bacterium]|jgi:repressor LexA|nr:transcriptional repressor LexA [Spirochaetaceae bacterium]
MLCLTEKQKEVLRFISEQIKQNSYPPTIREIAARFSISTKGAFDHVNALKRKQMIEVTEKSSRTIKLVTGKDEENSDGFIDIPLLGDVAAGKCILSEENLNGAVRIHSSMLKCNRKYFALTVRGDSMTGIGVMDGDTVIIEKHDTANNGDVVVVDVDDGGRALKRFFRQSYRIKLQSENPLYPPIYSTDVRIIGKLAGVYRTYNNE